MYTHIFKYLLYDFKINQTFFNWIYLCIPKSLSVALPLKILSNDDLLTEVQQICNGPM